MAISAGSVGGDLLFKGLAKGGSTIISRTAHHAGRFYRKPMRGVADFLGIEACFTGDTPLLETETTSKPIKDFRSYEDYGDDCDWILTRDEYNPYGPLVRRRVLRKFVRFAPVLNLDANGKTIETTAEHPFFVVERASGSDAASRLLGWAKAGSLRSGDVLLSHDGQRIVVERIVHTGRVTTVYNLQVEDCSTYFVGSESWGFSIWAHNQYIFSSLAEGRAYWNDFQRWGKANGLSKLERKHVWSAIKTARRNGSQANLKWFAEAEGIKRSVEELHGIGYRMVRKSFAYDDMGRGVDLVFDKHINGTRHFATVEAKGSRQINGFGFFNVHRDRTTGILQGDRDWTRIRLQRALDTGVYDALDVLYAIDNNKVRYLTLLAEHDSFMLPFA